MKLHNYTKQKHGNRNMLADQVGVARTYISNLCAGVRYPSESLKRRIQAATGGLVTVTDWPPRPARRPRRRTATSNAAADEH